MIAADSVVVGPPPSPNRKEYPFTGSIDFQGLQILVENKKGSTRTGPGWKVHMHAHYGEFADTLGMDGDAVDVYVGDDPDAPMAYVVHQRVPGTQVLDEDKVMVGFRTAREAKALYLKQYDKPGFFGGMTRWPVSELRTYLGKKTNRQNRLDQPMRVRRLVPKELRKGHGGAPNYRKSDESASVCSKCSFASGKYCELYRFIFSIGWTCDSFETRMPPVSHHHHRLHKAQQHSDAVSAKISLLVKEGKPQDQAVAIALSMERRGELEGMEKSGTRFRVKRHVRVSKKPASA